MRIIGLTGGIGSGKTAFSALLRARGAAVINADRLARDVVAPGSPGLAEIVSTFGEEVLDASGGLDRKRMAARVFSDRDARVKLEKIVHPLVRAAMADEVQRLSEAGTPLVLYDVPLLYEAGRERDVDAVVVVWAPHEAQLARLAARDGLSAAEAEARMAAQLPLDEKARRADFVVVNDGTLEDLAAKADALLSDLSRNLPKGSPKRY
ncbi:MAG TPA: dephospho-CoA kinase [Anaeromyxobacteraceae bacterium]|nr:dephospho-CoA kinase [Anaeromyxobacteraceae bacterium]